MTAHAYDPTDDYQTLVAQAAQPVFFSKLAAHGLDLPTDPMARAELYELGTRLLLLEQQEQQKQASAEVGSLRNLIADLDRRLGLNSASDDRHAEETAKAAASYLASRNEALTAAAARLGEALAQTTE